MCDFISVILPAAANDVAAKWRKRQFSLAAHQNASLQQALPRDYQAWLLTTGGCSCDLCRKHPKAKQTQQPSEAIALREDAAQIIRDLVAPYNQPSFLYIHFYSGDASREHLPMDARDRRTVTSLSSAGLPIMRDTLIELVADEPPRQA